jgi:uridylate kinase
VALCEQDNIPINVFDFAASGSIERIVLGEKIGTMVVAQTLETKKV